MLQTLLQSTRLAQHEYINAFGTDAWRETVSTSVNANHDHLYPADPDDPELDPDADDPDVEPATLTPVGAGLDRPTSSAPPDHTNKPAPRPQQPTAGEPPTPSAKRPSPADTDAALNVARSIFPDRANAAQSQPTVPTISATLTQTVQPNNVQPAAPPPPPPKPTAPYRDPREVHFDHTYRLLVDGKPW